MTILKSSLVLLASTTLASRLSKVHEDKMEHQAEEFDEDILNWDEDEFDEDWHPDELDEQTRGLRFEKLIKRMDANKDNFIDKIELINWTLKALMSMDAREVGSDFETADENGDGQISFDEYVKNIFGIDDHDDMSESRLEDNYELQDFNRQFHREHARWAAADVNNNGQLDAKEYELFYNPSQESDFINVALAEAIPRVDTNNDGKIDENEYMNDFKTPWVGTDEWNSNEKETFEDLDLDKSGFIDTDIEKTLWLFVDNGEISIDEADHLINVSDKDEDDKLSHEEVLNAMQDFIDSDATEYGFQLRHDEL